MIHFGQMKCGKVDQFGRLFHVVSEFFHVNFIPLIPLRSYLVVEETTSGAEASQQPIRLSFKSILIAWVRTAFILLILFNGVAVVRNFFRLVVAGNGGLGARPEGAWNAVLNPLWLVVGFAIFFALTYRLSKPSWTRTLHLAALLGLTERDLDAHLERLYAPRYPADPDQVETV